MIGDMFRFIHAADIHLDSPLKGLEQYDGAPVDAIRGATRRALENLVGLALAERVDFLLIAGDLYDGTWRDHNTGLFFVRQMSRLREAGIPLYLIAGNHDAVNKMTRSLRLPQNPGGDDPFFPAKAAETRRLEHLGVAIHGRSFQSAAEMSNLALQYPAADPGLINIGLLHTSLEGDAEHDRYAPCTLDDLRSKEYQYWALGHIHKRRIVAEDPPIVFSGNIQGRHIREAGAKGCYLISVDDRGKVSPEFHPLDVFRWAECDVDCSAAASGDEILDRFRRRLQELLDASGGLSLGVRVILRGASPFHQTLAAREEQWIAEIRSAAIDHAADLVWIEKVRFATTYPPASEAGLHGDAAAEELSAILDKLAASDDQLRQLAEELAPLKTKLPAELLDGADALALDDPAWLRSVLTEVQPLLLSRLSPSSSVSASGSTQERS